ncbi:S1 RNA binding domain protein [Ancylostoma duodenale]|uniref:S1 RNA binding domain protein n=1 Tax=Ancylostoma duodenale TaxID=51022 RepID=A0A0C2DMG2_9BILA|nr:S1 RNA binding domain protein [Ancylostoma duodenale]
MGVLDKEIDFPRGGAAVAPSSQSHKSGESHKEENQLFGVAKKRTRMVISRYIISLLPSLKQQVFKRKAKAKADAPSAKRKAVEEKAAVWSKPISLELLTDGVMGLGIVTEIHEDYVLLETADSCRVKLPATQGYSVGDRVKCTVIDVVPQTFLVCFSLPATDDGKVPLVTAIAYKQYLNKPEEIESFYSIGSEHMCRVMNFRYADRCLIVSTRKDMLSQKIVSYKDAVPGELLEAKVTDIHPRGLQVSICETVKGFIPADQASDKAVALDKSFSVGSAIKCRVWFVNEEKKQLWLTARHSLVNYKGTLITSYDSKYEGIVTVGIVAKVLQTGGALLQFFGTVRGLLAANEAKRLGAEMKLGQVLEVQVTSVDSVDRKMNLTLVGESLASTGHVLHPKEAEFCCNGERVFTAVVDEVSDSSIAGHRSERVMLHLESDPSVKGCLVPNLVSDSLDSPLESIREVFRKGSKVHPVAALGSLSGMNRLTDCVPSEHLPSKASTPSASLALQLLRSSVEEMCAFAQTSKAKLPVPGTCVVATVSQIVDDLLLITFNGKLRGCVRKSNHTGDIKEATAPCRVVLVKRDYIVVLPNNKNQLLFVPSRFHPNQVTEVKNARVSVGDTVNIADTIALSDCLHIGFLHGDADIISKLLPSSKYTSQTFPGKKWKSREKEDGPGKTKTELVRVAELTMAESKMAEARKKASAVAFQTTFSPGDVVRCFVLPDQDDTNKNILVEVNPLWSGKIAHEAVSDDLKIEAPEHDGEVFESLPKAGEMRMAKVLSAVKKTKSHRHGVLNLAFDMQADAKTFETGQKLTARVTHVNHTPLSVQFHLANGQQATLCATAIANNYEKVHLHMGHFKRDGIFHLYALRRERNPLRNYVVAEGRYESYLKQKENSDASDRRRLLIDRSEVVVGLTCDGFVAKHMPDAILVEIGPGIVGRIRKLHFPEVLKDRKRAAQEDDVVVPKKDKKKEASPEAEKVLLSDPGFDWSNTGFRPEDLAAVGKLGTEEMDEETDKQGAGDEQKKNEVKKEKAKDAKIMTKEEHDMEKERRLVHREVELSSDQQPETQEDFARLLRKDPNSAELWIREEAEIFNIWTAYLNMEVAYGDEATTKEIFQRACGNADSLKVHKQMAAIFSEADKIEVTAYPKKTDVWIVYADLCLKHLGIEAARQVLERACALPLSMHKLRPLFRKWMEAEQRYGDEKSRLLIREKAEKFLQSSLDDMEEVEQD